MFRMSELRRSMHVPYPLCPALRYGHLGTVEKFPQIKAKDHYTGKLHGMVLLGGIPMDSAFM